MGPEAGDKAPRRLISVLKLGRSIPANIKTNRSILRIVY